MKQALKVIQVRSSNGANRKHRATLESLGLGRIGKQVERDDSPQLQGMLHAVRHLVKVEPSRG